MRSIIAILIIILGLTSYYLVMTSTTSQHQTVYLEGKKLILSGIEDPEVYISGCGVSSTFTGEIVYLNLNCSHIHVQVYSHGSLVLSKTFELNS